MRIGLPLEYSNFAIVMLSDLGRDIKMENS